MPMPRTTAEILAAGKALHEAMERARPVGDHNPQILGVGGYTNGELGFKDALDAFRRDSKIIAVSTPHHDPDHFDAFEAAFNREFTQEKPDGKVRR